MLVIIGLIVGGMLVGQSLISQSQIRATVTAIDKYRLAYNAFVTKYNCVPGDCANATSFGLTGSPNCNSLSNGDGDGYIYSYDDGSTGAGGGLLFCESWMAFNHLNRSGMIGETSAYRVPIYNVPISNAAFMFFTSLRPKGSPQNLRHIVR